MVIPPERAFWILDYYRRHGTCLGFGARILGEEAECVITVTHVWPEVRSITIRLFADDGGASWDRLIPLSRGSFFLAQLGEPSFERYAQTHLHSVLHVGFPDGTTMVFAEGPEIAGSLERICPPVVTLQSPRPT